MDNINQKRQHNGAMLKDKLTEKTKVIENDSRKYRNKELIENIEKAVTAGSKTTYLSIDKVIYTGNFMYHILYIRINFMWFDIDI